MVRKLSMLLDSGIQLNKSLRLVSQTGKKKRQKTFQAVTQQLSQAVESGVSFHEGLGKYPLWFSPMMVALVRVGEESGRLTKVIQELLRYMDVREKYRKRLAAALTYPLVVVGVAILTVVFLIVFVLPTFSSMYADMGMELPKFTSFLLSVGNSLGIIIVGMIVVIIPLAIIV
ncbi:MAG: type II secretion system F family protein [Fidelibacterota bacterium]